MAKEDLSLAGLLKTPGQARREQLEKLRAEGATAAQTMLTAGQGFRSPIGGAISQLASTGASIMPELMARAGEQGLLALGGVAGATGRPDVQTALQRGAAPQPVQEARAVQELTKQYGTDSAGLYKIAEQLRKNGRADLAIRFEDKAKERELKERELEIDMLKAKGKADEVTYGASTQFIDSKGNLYSGTQVRPKTGGDFTYRFVPITPGAPEKPVGKVEIIEDWGMTSDAMLQFKSQQEGNKAYKQKQSEAINQIPTLETGIKRMNELIELAKTVESGGIEAVIKTKYEELIGKVPNNKQEFLSRVGTEMVKQLKPTFGGNPSEGELKALKALSASIQKNPENNVVILQTQRDVLADKLRVNRLYAESKNLDDFLKIIGKPRIEDNVNVDWNSLKK